MRIAAAQCHAIFDDSAAACDAVARRMQWADGQGVDLVLFPEGFLLGHSYDPATILARATAASGALDQLCQAIKACRATLVIGAFEAREGQIFNSAFVIAAGRVVGRYAKAHPNEPGVAAGSDFPTFPRSGLRYGINICNDANFAAPAAHLAEQGAALILYPLSNMLRPEVAERWREKSMANLAARARQTGCWVASSDVTGVCGDGISFGCTAILAPDGQVVARVPEMQEGVAVWDLA